MPIYQFGDFSIEATSEQEAVSVYEAIKDSKCDRALVVQSDDGIDIHGISIGKGIKLYVLNKNRLEYHGEMNRSIGDKIIDSIVDKIQKQSSDAAKARKFLDRQKRVDEMNVLTRRADCLDMSVPEVARKLYKDTVRLLDIDGYTTRFELAKLIGDLEVPSVAWIPILTWFRDNVLYDEFGTPPFDKKNEFFDNAMLGRSNTDMFRLRTAFATTITRIVKSGVANHSLLKDIVDQGKPFDWVRYAQNKE